MFLQSSAQYWTSKVIFDLGYVILRMSTGACSRELTLPY
jgi:hypothetical protein